MERYHSAYEAIEIKSSFMFFVITTVNMVIAMTFLAAASISARDIVPALVIFTIAIIMAYIIFKKKKAHKKVTILPWVVGFITTTVPVFQKYKYGLSLGDWTFALESYNSSIMLVVCVIALQLFHNKKLFIFYSIYGIANWVLFIFVAKSMGGVLHFNAIENGQPVHGVIVLREVFFMLMNIVLIYLSYRYIPVLMEFDKRTTRQRQIIEEQAEKQTAINKTIKENMLELVAQVDEQNRLIERFNEKMQSQSSTFEQISASLEELLGAAENIHVSSVDQLNGNIKMEEIVNEFKNIKTESTKNLRAAYDDIEHIVNRTSRSNENIREVEKTIEKIKQQSGKIAETVTIIVDIADKINLLSLNASIEAARAGDYGKGFAVVADEIGKLAYQTSESIKEIEGVLRENSAITAEGVTVIQSTAGTIKGLIDDMVKSSEKIKVLQESILVEERYINIIIDQMFKNIEIAKNIGIGTEEQKQAIEGSSKAIEHVNFIVGEMAAEIEELAATSNKILNYSTELLKKAQQS